MSSIRKTKSRITKQKKNLEQKPEQNLYSPNKPGAAPRTKTGFANATIARKTLRNISRMNKTYQKQVVITMYNRAKYHPHRTQTMLDAMRVYSQWMKKNLEHGTHSSKKKTKRNEKN